MIDERLDKIDKKLDTVIDNQHKMELTFTKRVGRNTFICNGLVWFLCAVAVAGLGLVVRLLTF